MIHSFFIPSLGVQRYAIPGRTIETWMKVDKPGDYYGECNQICGTNHSAMPIHVQAVTDAEYQTWLTQAKTKFASDLGPGQHSVPPARCRALARAYDVKRAAGRAAQESSDDVGHHP